MFRHTDVKTTLKMIEMAKNDTFSQNIAVFVKIDEKLTEIIIENNQN